MVWSSVVAVVVVGKRVVGWLVGGGCWLVDNGWRVRAGGDASGGRWMVCGDVVDVAEAVLKIRAGSTGS